jgi:hypothetical protein
VDEQQRFEDPNALLDFGQVLAIDAGERSCRRLGGQTKPGAGENQGDEDQRETHAA